MQRRRAPLLLLPVRGFLHLLYPSLRWLLRKHPNPLLLRPRVGEGNCFWGRRCGGEFPRSEGCCYQRQCECEWCEWEWGKRAEKELVGRFEDSGEDQSGAGWVEEGFGDG